MRTTKVMLAVLITFVMTCMLVGLVGYLLSDVSYRDCITNGGTIMFMMVLGWIPAAVVGYDYEQYLNQ